MRDHSGELETFSNHRHIIQQFITLTNEIPAWAIITPLTMNDLSDNGRPGLCLSKRLCLSFATTLLSNDKTGLQPFSLTFTFPHIFAYLRTQPGEL